MGWLKEWNNGWLIDWLNDWLSPTSLVYINLGLKKSNRTIGRAKSRKRHTSTQTMGVPIYCMYTIIYTCTSTGLCIIQYNSINSKIWNSTALGENSFGQRNEWKKGGKGKKNEQSEMYIYKYVYIEPIYMYFSEKSSSTKRGTPILKLVHL